MGTDFALIGGLFLVAIAVPSIMSSISEGRPPRFGALIILVGLGLIVVAVLMHPGGYSFSDVPDAFFRVLGQILP